MPEHQFFDQLVLSLCPPASRPVPGAPLPRAHGALEAAGPADAPAGIAWARRRHSSARGGSPGSDGLSSPGKAAPAQKMGKMGEKEVVG